MKFFSPAKIAENDSGIGKAKFSGNLIPVTIGNIIGGAVCVGAAYWFVYLKRSVNNRCLIPYDNSY